MTELSVGAEFSMSGMLPVPAVPPSPVDMFLAAGLPGDVLTLFDTPFHGSLLLLHPAVLTIKEMAHVRQVSAHALSDPLMHSQLGAYVHEAEMLFLQLEAVNHKVSGSSASLLPGGSTGGAPANTLPALPVSANAPGSIPPHPSSFLPPASSASANGQLTSSPQSTSPQSKQITFDNLIPFRGIAYAKEMMPEPYHTMLEKRMYLPLPALTHKNVHDLHTGLKHDEMAKIGDNKDPEAKLVHRPIMDPYLATEFAISKTKFIEAYQLLILTMKESPIFGGAVATMFESWFLELQQHTNWYHPRLWAALFCFDHKWHHHWFVDPNLTCLNPGGGTKA
ncbi:hypothetical protein BS47DRAFT_1366093 [Hydnum rufescens UP504]|uniref:Uncharacterized protein n=1 Tax=Hydnum rufescens UP504 TaxID=1448309 RepID=A0A9P6AM02_9AGAM|nr:hypothetical protein BS47DRAFT_1366093 [Hydnum rufescens UP504]